MSTISSALRNRAILSLAGSQPGRPLYVSVAGPSIRVKPEWSWHSGLDWLRRQRRPALRPGALGLDRRGEAEDADVVAVAAHELDGERQAAGVEGERHRRGRVLGDVEVDQEAGARLAARP